VTAINLELKNKKDNKLHLGRLPGRGYDTMLNGSLNIIKKIFNHMLFEVFTWKYICRYVMTINKKNRYIINRKGEQTLEG
jgi:hypothetical protein